MKHGKKSGTGLCLIAVTAGMLAAGAFFSQAAETGNRLTTLAGVPGNDYADGAAGTARFASPQGLGLWGGSVWIADTDNNLVRRYHDGEVSTVVGRILGDDAYGDALNGLYDGSCSRVLFGRPADCLPMPDGRVVVADRDNHAIRIIKGGSIYTLNGGGGEGYADGAGKQAKFSYPGGLARGKDGCVYVADTGNHCIRRFGSDGIVSLVAGVPGQGGYQDGDTLGAMFLEPTDIAVAEDGSIYVADTGNQRIRRIFGGQVTTVAGGGDWYYLDTEYRTPGFADGQGQYARFRFPGGICTAGPVVIVADTGNHVIRAVSPSGQVRVIAGNGDAGYEDGAALEAQLNSPGDVEWADGTLYIMDSGNSALRTMPFDPWKWMEGLQ